MYFHPLQSKADTDHKLTRFLEDIGCPQKLRFDGSREQTIPKSRFMLFIRKFFIKWHTTESYTPQHNKDEDAICEHKKRAKAIKAEFDTPYFSA